jgi:hypothetical protein
MPAEVQSKLASFCRQDQKKPQIIEIEIEILKIKRNRCPYHEILDGLHNLKAGTTSLEEKNRIENKNALVPF